ncbi:GNAT family N-acetyltransferase [Marinobacter sp. F3R08]|uniref:GNAT family N-acetyltransferase n=1 Tax=Marinobacter sp. F3R08 TaxID=2841559 RepID=UPI001C083492|nr:GNAT family N-acetyltransferase [Marinobacter sp. F3R08]MBU2954261.1 GNAT family N-acetyltransferase [Marinobacter sp. F3R08]
MKRTGMEYRYGFEPPGLPEDSLLRQHVLYRLRCRLYCMVAVLGTGRWEKTLRIDQSLEMQLLCLNHKAELFDLIEANREHLRKWLPWVDGTRSPADTESFIRSAISQYESGNNPHYAIFYGSTLCGACGFHPFDIKNGVGSLGYWLGHRYSGKGIMALCVKALVEHGFRECGLSRIEIACATGNTRSRRIPERLGFEYDGVLRDNEFLNGRYVDQAIYSMQASAFLAASPWHSDA